MAADAASNPTYRQLKEAFVSGTNGTSAAEVDAVLATASLLLLFYGLVVRTAAAAAAGRAGVRGGEAAGAEQKVPHTAVTAAAAAAGCIRSTGLEFVVLACPLTLVFTVAADYLPTICLALLAADAALLTWQSSTRRHLRSSLSSQCTPELCKRYITDYRGFMYLATAVCILAVDFPVFPRRFAKAESYGKGLMDIGVGSFVFSGALVSKSTVSRDGSWAAGRPPEARSWLASMLSASKVSLALLALGIGRLIVTSGADYQSHVTEYGVHWNFFITLAVVRVASTAVLSAGGQAQAWLCFAVTAAGHQMALSYCGVAAYVMREGDRDRLGITGFLTANREGLVSCIGYLAIHLAGAAIGQWLRRRGCLWTAGSSISGSGAQRSSSCSSDRLGSGQLLVLLSFGCAAAMLACSVGERFLEPVSRRTANLPYIFWTIHINLFVMSTVLLSNILLGIFASNPPSAKKVYTSKEQPSDDDRTLLASINNNGLFFFLIANVLTGLTNMTIDTMSASTTVALLVLTVYLLLVCLPVVVLHRKKYRLL